MKELWRPMLMGIFIGAAVCVMMYCFHHMMANDRKKDKPEKLVIEINGHDLIIRHADDCRKCKGRQISAGTGTMIEKAIYCDEPCMTKSERREGVMMDIANMRDIKKALEHIKNNIEEPTENEE